MHTHDPNHSKLTDTEPQSPSFQNTAMLYENILDSMDNGVIALDFEGKIITFNAAASRILGIDTDQALGKYYPEVFFEFQGNDEFNDVLINVIYDRQTYMYREVTFMRDEQTAVPLGITSSLLKTEQGHEYGVVSVFSDLSEVKKRQFLQDTLTRYVTKQVVDLILDHPENIILDGEERQATVMFSDIRDFTSLAEHMNPKELVQMLRAYFTLMVGAVFKFQGTVDKFIGDCIMAIFGA
ncbi:PAS domain-containing protein, partial [candidate division KSB3 bacterium]|nr:PAS domain-containing protein [candidate division KSB3 bacterium]MBD3326540.1 PAS domain-containing protein [candidate division KSB3 bacterium]